MILIFFLLHILSLLIKSFLIKLLLFFKLSLLFINLILKSLVYFLSKVHIFLFLSFKFFHFFVIFFLINTIITDHMAWICNIWFGYFFVLCNIWWSWLLLTIFHLTSLRHCFRLSLRSLCRSLFSWYLRERLSLATSILRSLRISFSSLTSYVRSIGNWFNFSSSWIIYILF